jgi:hypothetical protein
VVSSRVKHVALLSSRTIDGEEDKRMGLVNRRSSPGS